MLRQLFRFMFSGMFSGIFCSIAIQAKAQLEVPPHWIFQKMKTPHFEIIFNANQQELAYHYAEKLEEAYEKLSPYFSVHPELTIVVINDKTDVTNGYASRIPYPHIMAFPVLPPAQGSLADADDWALEFLAHEYTHILNFEPALGSMKTLRHVFGSALAPNLLLPTWWKEGLAVHLETQLSNGGRLRSPYQDSQIRAWQIENAWDKYDLASANESLPHWPEGATPYVFGSLFWAQTTKEYSQKVIDRINLRHAERVPYFIEQPALENFGVRYEEQYKKAMSVVKNLANNQVQQLSTHPTTPHHFFNLELQYASSPRVSPNSDKLAFIGIDQKDRRRIYIAARDIRNQFSKDSKLEVLKIEANNIEWSHDSQSLIYDKIDLINRYELRSDLWIYDIKNQKTKRLTHGWRAREASPSPDNNRIAFVQLSGGRTELALFDYLNKKIQSLYQGALMERISKPTFISDSEILFSSRRVHEKEKLYRISLKNPLPIQVLPQYENIREAVIFENKLYFISTQNTVPNIYISEAPYTKARALTHVLTGILSFSVDPLDKKLWLSMMTANGPQLAFIPLESQRNSEDSLPKVQGIFADYYPQADTNPSPTIKALSPSDVSISEYKASDYLWPQYWIPFIYGSSSGGLLFQASTSAFDPLKKHSYSLVASFDTETHESSLGLQYFNQKTQLPYIITASRNNSFLGSTSNKLTDDILSVSILPDTFSFSKNSAAQVGWQYIERTTTKSVRRAGPLFLLSYQDISQGDLEIAPSESWSAYAGLISFLKGDATYISHNRFLAGASLFNDSLLPEGHKIAGKLNAVYTPEKISATYGIQSESYFLTSTSNTPTYVMRGYAPAQFFGKNMAVLNFDYQFPLSLLNFGRGTDPYYLKRLSASLTSDSLWADGYVANNTKGSYVPITTHKAFRSFGTELRLDTSLGYLVPARFVLGYYLTPDSPDESKSAFGLSLQITGF